MLPELTEADQGASGSRCLLCRRLGDSGTWFVVALDKHSLCTRHNVYSLFPTGHKGNDAGGLWFGASAIKPWHESWETGPRRQKGVSPRGMWIVQEEHVKWRASGLVAPSAIH
jgi:hypothetical protein